MYERPNWKPVPTLTVLYGDVDIKSVVDAVNSLPSDMRTTMIGSLKQHASHVRWITLKGGRLSVA